MDDILANFDKLSIKNMTEQKVIPSIHLGVTVYECLKLKPNIIMKYNICDSTIAPSDESDENCYIIELPNEKVKFYKEDIKIGRLPTLIKKVINEENNKLTLLKILSELDFKCLQCVNVMINITINQIVKIFCDKYNCQYIYSDNNTLMFKSDQQLPQFIGSGFVFKYKGDVFILDKSRFYLYTNNSFVKKGIRKTSKSYEKFIEESLKTVFQEKDDIEDLPGIITQNIGDYYLNLIQGKIKLEDISSKVKYHQDYFLTPTYFIVAFVDILTKNGYQVSNGDILNYYKVKGNSNKSKLHEKLRLVNGLDGIEGDRTPDYSFYIYENDHIDRLHDALLVYTCDNSPKFKLSHLIRKSRGNIKSVGQCEYISELLKCNYDEKTISTILHENYYI